MNNRVYVGSLITDCSLYHHGILGMKWGVRRFQNKDGSLTSEGKKRYNSDKTTKDKEPNSRAKTALKVGVTLAAAALVAYGGYSLVKSGKLNDYIDKGRSKLSSLTGFCKSIKS